MTGSWKLKALAGLCAAAVLATASATLAQQMNPVLPPLSYSKAMYFQKNPAAWKKFLAQLPHRPSGTPQANKKPAPPSSGTWQAVTAAPAGVGLCNPLVLTDGSVLFPNCGTPDWYKLTPNFDGSYAHGSWSKLASLPVIGGTQYAPLYHSSAVLPDGRVIIMGGEYNNFNPVWTNLGAIYDPVANTWTAVSAPKGKSWALIGDSQSVVLPNGKFMQASCCAFPDADALFDANTLGWKTTGAPSAAGGYQDEQGYNLLPDGSVLTVDIWTNYPNADATNAEHYNPATGTWSSAGNTPVSMVDPIQCGNFEIGPAVLRPDGTVVQFGGNTGCIAGNTADPTAILDTSNYSWSAGPNIPAVCAGLDCDLADAPAALEPNGNILFAASSGYGDLPTHFFEFTPQNTINQVADPIFYAGVSGAYYYNFVVLPNGQILSTDFSNVAEVYSPVFSSNSFAWAPVIHSAPSSIHKGVTYTIKGTQLNGLSQGADYGDDTQTATNYPIVQITNTSTGRVYYARTFNHTTMSVAPGAAGQTSFIASKYDAGPCTLVVIANGIPSLPKNVTCKP